ncbi:MAG: hypothetical protein LEGION0403_FIIPPAGN_02104 [Legionella sp.]|uniref:hypothetical protein n=1 Tax=Legionella sp. TaxID=459 RepID=UPI003D140021
MKRNPIQIFSGIMLTLFSLQALAEERIRITVKTKEYTAAGIGYSVDGQRSGAIGKSYSGKGSKNRTYVFGYRKNSIVGANITCGSRVLTKDTTVTLVTKGEQCLSVIEE